VEEGFGPKISLSDGVEASRFDGGTVPRTYTVLDRTYLVESLCAPRFANDYRLLRTGLLLLTSDPDAEFGTSGCNARRFGLIKTRRGAHTVGSTEFLSRAPWKYLCMYLSVLRTVKEFSQQVKYMTCHLAHHHPQKCLPQDLHGKLLHHQDK
jgi:hypothetical protein